MMILMQFKGTHCCQLLMLTYSNVGKLNDILLIFIGVKTRNRRSGSSCIEGPVMASVLTSFIVIAMGIVLPLF